MRRVRITNAAVEKYILSTFVALGNQHAMRMRYIMLSSVALPGCTIFFHIISSVARFKKNIYWTQNDCFDFLYNFCLKQFSL